ACWTKLFYEGEEQLKEFIQKATNGEPELVFSDGFPCGYLPLPFFVILKKNEIQTKEDYEREKEEKKKIWFKRTEFEKTGKLTDEIRVKGMPLKESVKHNIIDRLYGSSLKENGLFTQFKMWYRGIWERVDIYVSTEWTKDKLCSFLKNMFEIGYGKDQSVGLGKVKIVMEPVKDNFPQISSDFYLSLSRIVPDDEIILDESFYKIETKYGKVWSGLNERIPFKKPIIQTIPGSVFKVKNSKKERVGRVLQEIHVNKNVIENCMGIIYPIPKNLVMEYVQV
ncbi:MAG: hypothetical protein N2053_11860, partial [Chitinispirillaceae bacterium]|nr:hypothetical protein [Chitinispirillaceae bacterium]